MDSERSDLQVLSVAKLRAAADPFRDDPWGIGRLTRTGVTRAVNRVRFHGCTRGKKPIPSPVVEDVVDLLHKKVSCRIIAERNRSAHVARIAWLVVHGWTDPIEIDVGVPVLGCYPDWIVCDGNHRLAAAIYRGDKTILASCGGQQSVIDEYHP